MGLFWCTEPTPPNFVRLQWLRWAQEANSGVFVRFPDPDSKGYDNTAFVAVDFGFEAQIDELARPDGAAIHRTGAIYRSDGRTDNENLSLQPAKAPGEWNDYEITIQNQIYRVSLNGQHLTTPRHILAEDLRRHQPFRVTSDCRFMPTREPKSHSDVSVSKPSEVRNV
jgi:hypothetical protein